MVLDYSWRRVWMTLEEKMDGAGLLLEKIVDGVGLQLETRVGDNGEEVG